MKSLSETHPTLWDDTLTDEERQNFIDVIGGKPGDCIIFTERQVRDFTVDKAEHERICKEYDNIIRRGLTESESIRLSYNSGVSDGLGSREDAVAVGEVIGRANAQKEVLFRVKEAMIKTMWHTAGGFIPEYYDLLKKLGLDKQTTGVKPSFGGYGLIITDADACDCSLIEIPDDNVSCTESGCGCECHKESVFKGHEKTFEELSK